MESSNETKKTPLSNHSGFTRVRLGPCSVLTRRGAATEPGYVAGEVLRVSARRRQADGPLGQDGRVLQSARESEPQDKSGGHGSQHDGEPVPAGDHLLPGQSRTT